MSRIGLFRSSLAKKYVMAVTGIILSLFVLGHMLGNLQAFGPPEAINAYARDILLTTKEMVNERGWEVVHGIVDSIWLGAADPDPAPIEAVVEAEIGRAHV